MSPIFVAIDTPDLERARSLAQQVQAEAGGVKLGLEFFSANGPAGVASIRELGLPVFLDLKLHDIPNTVAKAVEALRPLEAAVLTVHAAGGRAMLEAAKAAAGPATKVVAVTVLTSLDSGDLREMGVPQVDVKQLVLSRARRMLQAGCDGVISSGLEVSSLRHEYGDNFLIVVPGIRPVENSPERSDDQKRVVDVETAFRDGADYVVVGRPIRSAVDRRGAAADFQARIANVFSQPG